MNPRAAAAVRRHMQWPCLSGEGKTKPDSRGFCGCAAFTLLEMLVVLLIVGLTSTVVIPRLPAMADSLDFALKRQGFEQALNGLAYRAFSGNREFVLAGRYDSRGALDNQALSRAPGDGLAPGMRTLDPSGEIREPLPPVVAADLAPALPEGWELRVPEPIYFRGSGYCSGGRVELIVGRLRYGYSLEAPLCKASLTD